MRRPRIRRRRLHDRLWFRRRLDFARGTIRRAGASGSCIKRTDEVRAGLDLMTGSIMPSVSSVARRSWNGEVASCALLVRSSHCLGRRSSTVTALGILSTIELSIDGVRGLVGLLARTTCLSRTPSGSIIPSLNGSRSFNSYPSRIGSLGPTNRFYCRMRYRPQKSR